MDSVILKLHEELKNKVVTSEELVSDATNKAKNDETNSFVTINKGPKPPEEYENVLSGIPYVAKDNLSTKDILTTASSNTLKDYVPFYDATCVKKLKEAGCVGVVKTALDEFGMGGTGTTCHTGSVKNPWDKERIAGGSSAGSTASVACGCYPFALGTDTGDSIRKPAGYCGVVGYKPTYGMVSRYGLLPYASSLDTVGVLTRNVKDAAIVVDAMKGKDINDMTSWDSESIHLVDGLEGSVSGKKLFYIKELVELENYENVSDEFRSHIENFFNTIELCKEAGIEVSGVSIDRTLLNALPAIYDVISYAEATTNMSNLTGISFGPRGEGNSPEEMMKDHRTKGFSSLIKRRFVIGSYVLQSENQEKYFLNAKRVRRMIVDKMNELFSEYDGMIMPVSTGPAKYLDTTKNVVNSEFKVLEESLQIANHGGYPSITIPNGFVSGLPVGINITCAIKEDEKLLNIANVLESKMNFKDQVVGCEK
jgi:aspartyl-tRNA(Asn)/glutamyl-tRNA(Gln) amidotransferase subunit A